MATSLDYESRTSFDITVTAIDNPDGEMHNTGTTTITINVVDVNDTSLVLTTVSTTTMSSKVLVTISSTGPGKSTS